MKEFIKKWFKSDDQFDAPIEEIPDDEFLKLESKPEPESMEKFIVELECKVEKQAGLLGALSANQSVLSDKLGQSVKTIQKLVDAQKKHLSMDLELKATQEQVRLLLKMVDTMADSIVDCKKNTNDIQKETTDNSQKLEKKIDVAVDFLLERLSENEVAEDFVPKELKENKCPFKPKHGYCEIWAKRKNKNDGLAYCASCMRSSELLDQGIKL